MDRDAERVLQDALKLPVEAKAAPAGSLLDSLDTECDADAEVAWLTEIQRRSNALDSGAVSPVPWREVDARMRDALAQPIRPLCLNPPFSRTFEGH